MIRQRTIGEAEVKDVTRLTARLNQLVDANIAGFHGDTLDVSRTVRAQDRLLVLGPQTVPIGVTITVLGRMVIL